MTQMIARPTTAVVILFLLAALLPADAQGPHVARIGLIQSGSPATSAAFVDAFRQRLREIGYVEGRNVTMDVRYADDVRYVVNLRTAKTLAVTIPPALVARADQVIQ
jgi:putative ABC transport system substrate-binding protein